MAGDAHDRPRAQRVRSEQPRKAAPPGEVSPEDFWSPERYEANVRSQTLVRLAVSLALEIERSGMLADMVGPPPMVFPDVEEAIVRDVVAQLEARRVGRR